MELVQQSPMLWSARSSMHITSVSGMRTSRQKEFDQVAAEAMMRIAPASNAADGVPVTGFSATRVRPSTLGEEEELGKLLTALTNMASAEPPQLFADRYRLKAGFVRGGQALVVFALNDGEGFFQYAIKCVFIQAPMHCVMPLTHLPAR